MVKRSGGVVEFGEEVVVVELEEGIVLQIIFTGRQQMPRVLIGNESKVQNRMKRVEVKCGLFWKELMKSNIVSSELILL